MSLDVSPAATDALAGRRSRFRKRAAALAPAAPALAALALGMLLLGRRSLTADEAFTVATADVPLGEALRTTLEHEPSAAAFTALLHPLTTLSVESHIVRAPSVAAFGIAVGLAYVVGSSLHGRLAGLTSAAALATAAPAVAAAQRVEPVTLALALVLLSTWLVIRALEAPSARRWAAYGAVATLLPLVHPACAAALAGHGAAIALDRRLGDRRPALAAIALPATFGLILLCATTADRWSDGSGATAIELARAPWAAIGWNPVLAVLAIGGLAATATWRGWAPARWKIALEVGLIGGPLAVVMVVGSLVPTYGTRAGTIALAGCVLAAGACVAAFVEERVAFASCAAATVVAVCGLGWWYVSRPAEDWRAAARAIDDPGLDSVVVVPDRAQAALARESPDTRVRLQARGDVVAVLVKGTATDAATAARAVVPTPRYALLEQRHLSDELVLQRWIRP